MGFVTRFLEAWRAAASDEAPVIQDNVRRMPLFSERPGSQIVQNGKWDGVCLSPELRASAAEQGLSGKAFAYLCDRADAELSAREFAEQFGNGYD